MFRCAWIGALAVLSCGGKLAPDIAPPERTDDETPTAAPSPPIAPPSGADDGRITHPTRPGMTCAPDPAFALGVAGKRLYWVLSCTSTAGASERVIASAPAAGGKASIVYAVDTAHFDGIASFSVDAHAVFQRGAGSLFVIPAGTTNPVELMSSNSPCVSTTTDAEHVYCRVEGPNGNVYVWPVDGSASAPRELVRLGANASWLQIDGGFLYFANAGKVDVYFADPHSLDRGGIFRIPLDRSKSHAIVHETPNAGTFRARGGVSVWTRWYAEKKLSQLVAAPFPEAAPIQLDLDADDPVIDPSDAQLVWYVKRDTALARIMKSTTLFERALFQGGLDPKTRIAVDATHVYWTTPEGIDRRAKLAH